MPSQPVWLYQGDKLEVIQISVFLRKQQLLLLLLLLFLFFLGGGGSWGWGGGGGGMEVWYNLIQWNLTEFFYQLTFVASHRRIFKGQVQGLGWFLTQFPLKFAENNDVGETVIWVL